MTGSRSISSQSAAHSTPEAAAERPVGVRSPQVRPRLQVHDKDSGLAEYTLAEVKEKGYTVIGDGVYDLKEYVEKHPGGALILQGIGRDATVLFQTSHPMYVEERVLPKFLVGRAVRPRDQSQFEYSWDSDFYRTLRGRVEKHLKSSGAPAQGTALLWFGAIFTLSMWAVLHYLTHFQGYWWLAVPCGWFLSQLGIQIMHDGNHGAFSKNPRVNMLAASVMDILGGSSFVWRHQHNIGHHQFTNSVHDDPDVTTGYPIIRFNPSQRWLPHHRFQHFYVFVLYGIHAPKWFFFDFINMFLGKYRTVEMYTPTWEELFCFFTGKAFVFSIQFLIPFLYDVYHYGPLFGPVRWFLTFAAILTTASYCFAFQFVVNHLVTDCIFPEEYKKEHDWARLQVMTTCNYSTGSRLWNYLSGGLNHQIEHHLFPTLAHTHYPHIAPIVRSTCAEFGVPYFEHPTWFHAIYYHFDHMRAMSLPPKVGSPSTPLSSY